MRKISIVVCNPPSVQTDGPHLMQALCWEQLYNVALSRKDIDCSEYVNRIVMEPQALTCSPSLSKRVRHDSNFCSAILMLPSKFPNIIFQHAEFNSGVIKGVHHVALLCQDLETSMDFYVRVLGTLSHIDPFSRFT